MDSRCRSIRQHRVRSGRSSAQAPDLQQCFTWSEEKLELATSLLAMRTIRLQPRGLEAENVHNTQEAGSHLGSALHWQRRVRGPSSCACTCALCSRGEVDARGDGTHTLPQSTTLKADDDACL